MVLSIQLGVVELTLRIAKHSQVHIAVFAEIFAAKRDQNKLSSEMCYHKRDLPHSVSFASSLPVGIADRESTGRMAVGTAVAVAVGTGCRETTQKRRSLTRACFQGAVELLEAILNDS